MAWHRIDESWHGMASYRHPMGIGFRLMASHRIAVHRARGGAARRHPYEFTWNDYCPAGEKIRPPQLGNPSMDSEKKTFQAENPGVIFSWKCLPPTRYQILQSYCTEYSSKRYTLLRTTRRRSGPCSVFYYIVYFYLCTGKVGLKNSWTLPCITTRPAMCILKYIFVRVF